MAFDPDAFLRTYGETSTDTGVAQPARPVVQVAPAPPAASTTVATNQADAAKERRLAAKEEMSRGRLEDATTAALYGLQRGMAPGADRLAGIGADLGESVASLVHDLPPPAPDTARKAREQYLRDEAAARDGSPTGFVLGEIAGAAPMTIGAAGGGVALRGAGAAPSVATGFVPAARAVAGRVGQIANTPAARVAEQNFAAGAMNSRSDNPADQARAGLASTAGGEVAGVVGQKVGKFLGESVAREYRGLMRDIMRNAETDVSANPTVRRRFMNRADAALQEVKNDKVLAKTVREGDSAGAGRIAESKLQVISEPRAGLYNEMDTHGVVGIDQLDTAIRNAEKHAVGAQKAALEEFRRTLNDDWIPKWKEEGMLVTRKGLPLGVKNIGVRQWVSAAQQGASKTLGTIAETEHAAIKGELENVAEDLWDKHLSRIAKEDPKLVNNIREYDRRASGLLALKDVMENRAKKDAEGAMGWGKKHEGKIDALVTSGAGLGALAGHPAEAAGGYLAYQAAKRIPTAAAAINDKMLAPLQRKAAAGVGWAELARDAAALGVPQGMARVIFDSAQRARGSQSTQTSTAVR